jgi:hypothetical protein
MHQIERDPPVNVTAIMSFWIGAGLAGLGALALLYLTGVVLDVLLAPGDSKLVTWVVQNTDAEDLVVSGKFNETVFELRSSAALQYIVYGCFALLLVSLVMRIVQGVITTGMKLIEFSKTLEVKAQAEPPAAPHVGGGAERQVIPDET